MSHKRKHDKQARRSERIRAGHILAGVVPAAPLEGIVEPAMPALTAAEQQARLEALRLFEIFEREIVAPLRERFLRAVVVNGCRGMVQGLKEAAAERK